MADPRAAVLASLLGEAVAHLVALEGLYRHLAEVAQPESIRPALLELAGLEAVVAREGGALAASMGTGPGPGPGDGARSGGPPGSAGSLLGLRGQGLAGAFSAERALQAVLREARTLSGGTSWAEGVAGLAARADHRRQILDLYQRYS